MFTAVILLLTGCGETTMPPAETESPMSGGEQTLQPLESEEPDMTENIQTQENEPVVYMTKYINPEGLRAVYEALGWTPAGNVAVKLSTGEPPASNYLRPELIADLVRLVDGTIVECNTAYGGSRASTALHLQVAEDHGFTAIADVDIQDADGSMAIPVTGGMRLTENFVGASFADYDSYLVLSHFKAHAMAGFGGERGDYISKDAFAVSQLSDTNRERWSYPQVQKVVGSVGDYQRIIKESTASQLFLAIRTKPAIPLAAA